MVVLKEITLKNFKSFKGETKVNVPLLTAIVGCNGAGKSNFVDAISFAMGVNPGDLRVSRIQELVYRSNCGDYRQNMFVTAVLESSDGAQTSFGRSFEHNFSRYRIDDNEVSRSDYADALKRLGINARIKNFVVFQNSVESIVTQSPSERTAMFEEISGSVFHAQEYKRLRSEVHKLEQELQLLHRKRRSVTEELKLTLYSKDKAHEYRALEKKYNAARVQLILFNVHCAERRIRRWTETMEETSARIFEVEAAKRATEEKLKAATKTYKKLKLEGAIAKSDAQMTTELARIENEFAGFEAAVKYAENKVASCKASLDSARKTDEDREQREKQLREALQALVATRDEYTQRFQMFATDSRLRESQHEEYERLAALCLVNLAVDHQRIFLLEREKKSAEDELEAATRERNRLQASVDRKCALRLEVRKRAARLETSTREIKRELETEQRRERELRASVESSRAKERELCEEREEIARQIEDSKLAESAREKNQIVKDLRRIFPSVLDRLGNMCYPIHERYSAATTRVLGRHLDSVVVETSETAELCIRHLKDQCIGIGTFLPLDDVAAEPINQQLRDIGSPPNVRLLYDVISFDSRIARVVQFVTRNTLVCETPEHAALIAFATRQKPHDCVSVDGMIYRKSGVISGGSRDPTPGAQRCDSSLVMRLLSRKAELIGALREIRRKFPRDPELAFLQSKVAHLERRLEYATNDYNAATKRVTDLEFEIRDLEDELDASTCKCDEIQSKANQLSMATAQIKSKIVKEEKKFYSVFCEQNALDVIRNYEEGLNRRLREEKMTNFQSQIDCLKVQLDFETARNTAENVSRWESELREAEQILQSRLEQKRVKLEALDDLKKRIRESEMRDASKRRIIDEVADKLKQLKSELDAISKERTCLSKQITATELFIDKEKAHRNAALIDAKVQGLKIPLIDDPPNDSSDASDFSMCEIDDSARYDFSKLPRSLTTSESPSEIRAAREKLERDVAEIGAAIDDLADPNMKASQQAQMLREELARTNTKIKQASKSSRKAAAEFERVKLERYGKFMKFFERAAVQVDVMYKKLTKSPSAQAYLLPENPEEPYLGGIRYDCIAPGKLYKWPSALSGGEKTLAALPLLFAANSGESPPFRVLDEIDAALDSHSSTKVLKCLDDNKDVQQSIVISHKKEVFGDADALVGIFSVMTEDGPESGVLTFDLRCYRR